MGKLREVVWGVEDGTSEKLSLRLAIGDVDIIDLVLLKKLENALSRVESGVAVAVGKDADPNDRLTTNLITDYCAQVILAEFSVPVDGDELHLADILRIVAMAATTRLPSSIRHPSLAPVGRALFAQPLACDVHHLNRGISVLAILVRSPILTEATNTETWMLCDVVRRGRAMWRG
ncbi:hypothetical protein EVG20_g6776 [Dentipellis fragilis]|uniref:Uncharacterized protein n=1 Tax=Dentipellis fragilis TaxID=205917 RepID=A0A4Y9YI73_9AGAM|nr:hypothetical protein EVG20_g6776 [Dentipellis fragilis]